MKPKLGLDVHYHDHHGRTFAAKITKVTSDYTVNLLAFDDGTGALGGPIVPYQDVPWATTYGYAGGWSFTPPDLGMRPDVATACAIPVIGQNVVVGIGAGVFEPPIPVTLEPQPMPIAPPPPVTLVGLLEGIKKEGE
jgi:hypothetical protein